MRPTRWSASRWSPKWRPTRATLPAEIQRERQLPEALRDVVAAVLHQPGALRGPEADPRLKALTEEARRATHFAAPGSKDVAAPRKGARPGDGLAAFVFCAAFKRSLQRVRDDFQVRGLLCRPSPPKR